jgi:hypothetical protein
MKLKLQLALVMLLLVGCNSPVTPFATIPSLPAIPSPSPEITPTLTPAPTATELPSATPTLAITATAAITEISPEAVGICPVGNPDLKPNFKSAFSDGELARQIPDLSLNFLNQGGTVDALHAFLAEDDRSLYQGDLTGDGVPEMGVSGFMVYGIIGCVDNTYMQLKHINLGMPGAPEIFSVKDMNENGIPDIVFFTAMTCGFHACFETLIFEWDKTEFKVLSKDPFYENYGILSMAGPYGLTVRDIDSNGTLELMLDGGVPNYLDYIEGVPWRNQTDIYMWDGEAYSLYRNQFTEPEYRFQAVQDGDEAARWNEFDKALTFYQQAIFDDELKAWSYKQLAYEQQIWHERWEEPTPIPPTAPAPDTAEYPNLAAYARYRIMLLHLQQGYDSDAKVVYDTLQKKFPEGQAGHAYAELAEAFWLTYQTTHNLTQSCAIAIKYAAEHEQEILNYLGNVEGSDTPSYHGTQSYPYQPKDVCQFLTDS